MAIVATGTKRRIFVLSLGFGRSKAVIVVQRTQAVLVLLVDASAMPANLRSGTKAR